VSSIFSLAGAVAECECVCVLRARVFECVAPTSHASDPLSPPSFSPPGVVHIVDAVLVPSNFAYPKNDIVTTAAGVSTLSTLVTAVKAANLVDALTYPHGPYTVFAPSNQAFAELPAGVLNYLLAHPTELAAVILYHVVDFRGDFDRGARIYASEIKNDELVFTLNGQPLVFVVNGGSVLVNGNATVTTADVDTSNGVVHIINQVLIPNAQGVYARAAAWNAQKKSVRGSVQALPNIVALAQSVPQLSTLVTAVQAAGLVNVLSTTSPLTVFAPTNDAFAKLPDQYLAYLLSNVTALTAVLTNHVISGNYTAGTLKNNEVLPTLDAPHNVTITIDRRGGVFVDYAQVIAANNMASNGVVHIVDEVILPIGY
jgi:transforming growth factor-beta-induced protein